MKITDETLSAFLDAELPEADMNAIRQQISEDEQLSNRLAELASVDQKVVAHYSKIDEQPLPESITRLLATDTATNNNVITFPWWRRAQHSMQGYAKQYGAIAAAVALMISIGIVQFIPSDGINNANWTALTQSLNTRLSGDAQLLPDGTQLMPRLSFINKDGHYCRQFQLSNESSSSENIACRTPSNENNIEVPTDRQWTLLVSRSVDNAPQEQDYQTASGGAALDDVLDEIMAGPALNRAAEQDMIAKQWQEQ